MKRIFSILFAVVLVLSFSLIPAVPAAAATINVPGDHTTIQAAVDAASSGDTINVAAGTYTEAVTIDKSLTLTGDVGGSAAGPGPNAPILDGGGMVGSAITIAGGVSNVTIEGFEITNYRNRPAGAGWTTGGIGSAILAWNSIAINNVTVRNNYMHDLGWSAVLVGNEGQALHDNWLVEKNVVEDWAAYGIELTNTKNSSVRGNKITGGTGILGESGDDSQDAIIIQAQVHKGSGLTVATVTVDHNSINGPLTRAGIELLAWDSTNSRTAVLNNITVSNNSVGGAARGIFVFSVGTNADIRNSEVEKNKVSNSGSDGIYLWVWSGGSVSNNEIEKNKVSDSGRDGIALYGGASNDIEENKVSDSGRDGIALYGGASTNEVEENKVDKSGDDGIALYGTASDNQVEDNKVKKSGSFDLSWDSTGTGNTWEKNKYETSNF